MSDIIFLVGGIGQGKSRLAAEYAMKNLESTERMLVTNLALYDKTAPEGRLTVAEWCHEFIKRPVNLSERMRILDKTEVLTFPQFLPGYDIPMVPWKVRTERSDLPEWGGKGVLYSKERQDRYIPNMEARQELQREGKIPMGCLYIIDEVHLYFGAREWQQTGSFIEHYMSQLRKLNDDLILITQEPDKVDKNFRRNATEWIYSQNMAKKRLWGGVSFAGQFRWYSYPVQPTRHDHPQRSGVFELKDRRLCDVYDTMAGVGLTGSLKPENLKPAGGHWWRWVAIGCVILLGAFLLPRLIMGAIGKTVHGMTASFMGTSSAAKAAVKTLPQSNPPAIARIPGASSVGLPPPVASVPYPLRQVPGGTLPRLAPGAQVDTEESAEWAELRICGVIKMGNTNLQVALTDGRLLSNKDFDAVGPDWVVVQGHKIREETPKERKRRLGGLGPVPMPEKPRDSKTPKIKL